MKKLVFGLMAAGLIMLGACEKERIVGEGPVVTQTRMAGDFKGISVSVGGKVTYRIDPVPKIEISAQQNILNVLETYVLGDELVIKFKDRANVRSHEEIAITISAPTAEFATLSGSADLKLLGNMTVPNFTLRVSGSGNISAEQLTLAGKLTASISGSGNINVLAGTSVNGQLKISGSGNIDVSNVAMKSVVTDISGSGHMKINASQALDATISGSGSVFYKGTPQISTHISGSGSVRPL